MKDQLRQKVHDIRGSLAVIQGFLRCLQPTDIPANYVELMEAAQISSEKITTALEELQQLYNEKTSSES